MTGKTLSVLRRVLCSLSLVCAFFLLAPQSFAQSFTLTVTPSVTLHPGDQGIPISVSVSSSTYTGPVYVTLKGLPTGITATPITLTPGSSGTLYVNATVSADQEAFPATDPTDPNTATSSITVVGVAGSVQATTSLSLTVSLTNDSFAPAASAINLPIVSIDTSGVAVTSKDTLVPATITITSADKQKTYLPSSSDSDNTATIHVHGNSTARMPKLPYEFKLGTSVDLLGSMGLSCPYVTSSGKSICDKSKTYVLLANYDDKAMLRDWAASTLANAIPMGGDYLSSAAGSPTPSGTDTLMPWAPHSLYVELYVNGQYEGNYELIEKVNVDSHRINISELDDTDSSGDLSGGYQMEIDAEQGEDYNFITPENVYIGMVDPDFTPEVPEQEEYIANYIETAEAAMFSSTFTDATTGWRAYFDEAAAVNFYIVNDLLGNQDGATFYSSDYFYKAADNPLLYMGPVWDFDIGAGNINSTPAILPTAPLMQNTAWYAQLLKDPSFKADLAKQWNALKKNGVFSQWITSVTAEASALEQSQKNNYARWPTLGIRVWPNAQAYGTYDSEVGYMTDWIQVRMGYMDTFLNSGKTQTTTTLTIPSGTLRQGSAATFTAHVSGGSSPTGNVYLISCGAIVGVGALDGSGNATITSNLPSILNFNLELPQTTDALMAIYPGDNTNALSSSTTTNVSVLLPLVPTTTTLTSAVANATSGTPASFSVTVVANSGSTVPTGTVNLTEGGTTLASAAIDASGTAAFSPATFPGGVTSLQATYVGTSAFAASTSNAVTVTTPAVSAPVLSLAAGTFSTAQTVTISEATSNAVIYYTLDGTTPSPSSTQYSGAITITSPETLSAIALLSDYATSSVSSATYDVEIPGFTIAITPETATFRSSDPARFFLTLTPDYGFNSQISFTCSGLAAGDGCTFSPSTVTPGNSAINVSITLSHSGSQAAALDRRIPFWTKLSGGVAMALMFWPFRRRKIWAAVALLFLLAASLGLSGCSSGPKKGFVMTVTASGGGVSHAVNVVVN